MTRPPQSCVLEEAVIVIIIKARMAVILKTIFFIFLLFYFVTLFVVLDVEKLQKVAIKLILDIHTAQEIVGNDVEAADILANYSRCMVSDPANETAALDNDVHRLRHNEFHAATESMDINLLILSNGSLAQVHTDSPAEGVETGSVARRAQSLHPPRVEADIIPFSMLIGCWALTWGFSLPVTAIYFLTITLPLAW